MDLLPGEVPRDRWERPSLVAMIAVLKGRVGGGQAEEDFMEAKERFNVVEDLRRKC